ncbi:AIPR family protein [Salinicoccus roseus]|uniref:AIPR family protein n=1 Tax=Salinicoccus roseus TaxID=45670 RepID=UPI0023007C1C|nr:AIPR family protein [Salinicoccus roseus]
MSGYEEGIKNFLNSMDIEEFSTEKLEKNAYELEEGDRLMITSNDIELGNEELFIIIIKEQTMWEDIEQKFEEKEENELKDFNEVIILELFEEVKNLHLVTKEKQKAIRNEIKKVFNKRNNKIKLGSISYDHVLITRVPVEKEISISINSRIRSLEQTKKIGDHELRGLVFSAQLKDVMKLYEIMGDNLFEKNLRAGINDQLGVDSSIAHTIKHDEEDFWFLNNGISLYIRNEKQINLKNFSQLKIKIGNEFPVSVINGAQTMSAVSRTDYPQTKAYVLLRVFTFNSLPEGESKEKEYDDAIKNEIDKITLALNRQKPIKEEDVAFTYNFSHLINNLQIEQEEPMSKFLFQIVRRGEIESNTIKKYSLINFARVTKAYLDQKPGEARSKGAVTLLKKHPDEEKSFKEENIFKVGEETNDFRRIFEENYKPVNFAFKLKQFLTENFLLSIYSEIREDEKEEESQKAIKAIKSLSIYGRYFIIAIYIASKNNYDDDFREWKLYDIKDSDTSTEDEGIESPEQLKTDVRSIYNGFLQFIKNEYESEEDLDANSFKSDKIYNDFKNYYKSIS